MGKIRKVKKCAQWRGVSVKPNVLAPLTIANTQIPRERALENVVEKDEATKMAEISTLMSDLSISSSSFSSSASPSSIIVDETSNLIESPKIPEKYNKLFQDDLGAINDESSSNEQPTDAPPVPWWPFGDAPEGYAEFCKYLTTWKSHTMVNKETQTDTVFFLSQSQFQEFESTTNTSIQSIQATPQPCLPPQPIPPQTCSPQPIPPHTYSPQPIPPPALKKVQTNEKNQKVTPFQCNACGKYFSKKSNLTAHSNSVHAPLRPKTVCGIDGCLKEYMLISSLRRHIRAEHPVEFDINFKQYEF